MNRSVRELTKAIEAAVAAAGAKDAEGLRDAAADLSKLDGAHTGKVLGGVLRMLLEQKHPDGLDGDDIRALLQDTTGRAMSWLPETDPHTLLVTLAGALGIHPDEHEQVIRPAPEALALNAPLLVADLLLASKRGLDFFINATLADIARDELMEAP